MNSNFKELITKFKKINKMGYVKGVNNNITNSCGLTFESLLNEKPNSSYLPDYKDIEIKTTQRFSRYSIGLFSLKFDGPSEYETNYILEKYGIENLNFNNYKELIVNLKIKEKVLVNDKYYFELTIDYISKKILINIFDLDYKYIESRAFINFDSLNERINTKIQKLALIFGSKKLIDNQLYFRYYQINCYEYKDFPTFLKLIETGDIKLVLMLRFAKSGKNIGQNKNKNKNKNIMFRIKKNSISKLYNEIYSYED